YRVGPNMREVRGKSELLETPANVDRPIGIVRAQQYPGSARVFVAIDLPFGHAIAPGQIHVKHGASAGRIEKINRAAEPGDDLLDDAQAKTGAALAARVGRVALREFLEHVRPKIGRDAGAVIAHR